MPLRPCVPLYRSGLLRLTHTSLLNAAPPPGNPPHRKEPTTTPSVASSLAALRCAPAYLRHAPPTQYHTISSALSAGPRAGGPLPDAVGAGTPPRPSPAVLHGDRHPRRRHRTLLLDEVTWRTPSPSATDAPENGPFPHTRGVYLLSSTTSADMDYTSPDAASALIGLPHMGVKDDLERFLDVHGDKLKSLRSVCLTEVTPSAAVVCQALQQRFPRLAVFTADFGHAFLCNETFYRNVLEALHLPPSCTWLRECAVEPLPDAVVRRVPAEGCTLDPITLSFSTLTTADAEKAEGVDVVAGGWVRPLQALPLRDGLVMPESRGRERRQPTAHLEHRRLFFYDAAFRSVFCGDALLRLPWLQHVMTPPGRSPRGRVHDATFVLPSLTAASCATHPIPPSSAAAVIHYWDPQVAAAAVAAALAAFPLAQPSSPNAPACIPGRGWEAPERVLCSRFGELPDIAGGLPQRISAITAMAEALTSLRGRLGRRLAAGGLGATDAATWAPKLLRKIFSEAVCGDVPSAAASAAEDDDDVLRAAPKNELREGEAAPSLGTAASAAAEWEERVQVLCEWCATGDDNPLRLLSECLTASAVGLPPPPAAAAEGLRIAGVPEKNRVTSVRGDEAALPAELTGAAGMALMEQILDLKQLGALKAVVRREEIDVTVFLSMTSQELQRVFKATFGLRKKLEQLQTEVRRKTQQVTSPTQGEEKNAGSSSSRGSSSGSRSRGRSEKGRGFGASRVTSFREGHTAVHIHTQTKEFREALSTSFSIRLRTHCLYYSSKVEPKGKRIVPNAPPKKAQAHISLYRYRENVDPFPSLSLSLLILIN
eukprot:gene11610-7999_t